MNQSRETKNRRWITVRIGRHLTTQHDRAPQSTGRGNSSPTPFGESESVRPRQPRLNPQGEFSCDDCRKPAERNPIWIVASQQSTILPRVKKPG